MTVLVFPSLLGSACTHPGSPSALSVGVLAVENGRHGHDLRDIVYFIDNPVVADSDAIVLLTNGLSGAAWAGIITEAANNRTEARLSISREASESPQGWSGNLSSLRHPS